MRFQFGEKVMFEDEVVVITGLDESDDTYTVVPEGLPEEWRWVKERELSPCAPAGAPLIVGVGAGPSQNTQGPFGVPVDLFGMPLGQRMRYDNSSARRKDQPVTEGYLDYFPATARLTAELSRLGNEKHNPGEPLHHARAKSKDHRNCAVRHLMDADVIDPESGLVEAVGAVWRSSAYVQELAENVYGWPKAPRAR